MPESIEHNPSEQEQGSMPPEIAEITFEAPEEVDHEPGGDVQARVAAKETILKGDVQERFRQQDKGAKEATERRASRERLETLHEKIIEKKKEIETLDAARGNGGRQALTWLTNRRKWSEQNEALELAEQELEELRAEQRQVQSQLGIEQKF
jgi:hypothetical protein